MVIISGPSNHITRPSAVRHWASLTVIFVDTACSRRSRPVCPAPVVCQHRPDLVTWDTSPWLPRESGLGPDKHRLARTQAWTSSQPVISAPRNRPSRPQEASVRAAYLFIVLSILCYWALILLNSVALRVMRLCCIFHSQDSSVRAPYRTVQTGDVHSPSLTASCSSAQVKSHSQLALGSHSKINPIPAVF